MAEQHGSYDLPSRALTYHRWRPVFLEAVRQQAPAVLAGDAFSLAGAPFAQYQELAAYHPEIAGALRARTPARTHPAVLFYYGADGRLVPDAHDDDETRPFTIALAAWGHHWHLTDAWCMQAALATLRRWQAAGLPDAGPWEPVPLFVGGSQLPVSREEAVFTFSFRGYDGVTTSRQAAWQAWVAAAKQGWDAHCWNIDQANTARGAVPAPPAKREREHFAWAVRWHVLGESMRHIAQDVSRTDRPRRKDARDDRNQDNDRRTVARGIHDVLTRVGVTSWRDVNDPTT